MSKNRYSRKPRDRDYEMEAGRVVLEEQERRRLVGRTFKAIDIVWCLLIFVCINNYVKVYLVAIVTITNKNFLKTIHHHCKDRTFPTSAFLLRYLVPWIAYNACLLYIDYVDKLIPGPWRKSG
ncbi:unnamed protein product [Caenorhabditis sp. 36 PRJEB53466]|nr:unnamed protein product [Caenorhabditis sp. 36 PRJEB53466]